MPLIFRKNLVYFSSWVLILTVQLTAPIVDSSGDVPGTFERELDGLAALAREQRSVDGIFPAEKKIESHSDDTGPKCFLESRPHQGAFKQFDSLLETADTLEGECQEHFLKLIEDQSNGMDMSKRVSHQECLSRCSDSEVSKKACGMFLPKSDKYYHKLVVKSKTTGKRFGICVRTTSFDSDDNVANGVFNSKRECKDTCGFSDSAVNQKRSDIPLEKKSEKCGLYPCENGGTCVNQTCKCPSGFNGARCENKMCIPSCKNNGVCNNGKCLCIPYYTGVSCETAICKTPCQNGGVCKDPLRNICQCPSGYFGSHCTDSSCIPFCQNGGKCTAPNTCSCTASYEGATCNVSRCREEDPGNRGYCAVNPHSNLHPYVVKCYEGYSGAGCKVKSKCDMVVSPGYSKKIIDEVLANAKSDVDKLDWTGNKDSFKTCVAFLKTLQQQCGSPTLTLNLNMCEKICCK